MATTLKYPTSTNAVQKTLDAALLAGVTAAATLNSVVGIQNKAGVFVVDRVDSNGTATPSKREYIVFTGVSGSTLTTLTRNADGGGTDQDHAVGAIVEFVSDVLQEQAILDGLLLTVTTAGVLNRATGANINTGTDDDKIVTAKAIADSYLGGATSNIQTQITSKVQNDGWINANETWTYASASTITIPAGGAAKYAVGDRIRWKQGAGYKYGVLKAVADTLLTILVNTDFTVATPTAITDNYYSHQQNPIGYPHWFNIVAPTWLIINGMDNGSGGQPTTTTHKAKVDGNTLSAYILGSGTKNATTYYLSFSNVYGVTPLFSNVVGSGMAQASGYNRGTNLTYEAGDFYIMSDSSLTIADNQVLTTVSGIFSFQF